MSEKLAYANSYTFAMAHKIGIMYYYFQISMKEFQYPKFVFKVPVHMCPMCQIF